MLLFSVTFWRIVRFFLFFLVSAEKQWHVQWAGGGGRGLCPDERGVLQVSDGRHRGAPGGGGRTWVISWHQGGGKVDLHVELCWRGDSRVWQCWKGESERTCMVWFQRTDWILNKWRSLLHVDLHTILNAHCKESHAPRCSFISVNTFCLPTFSSFHSFASSHQQVY